MRIVIDMQGAQTASRLRGIGRYTLALVSELITASRGQHEILLVLNGLLATTIAPIRTHFAAQLPAHAILTWIAPGPVNARLPANHGRRVRAELLREAFLGSLSPDIVFVPSVFEGFIDDAVVSVRRLNRQYVTCVTIHDLIPILNPDVYLKPNPVYKAYYERQLAYAGQSDWMLSISASSRQEASDCFELAASRIVNASAAVDRRFAPRSLTDTEMSELCRDLDIWKPFLLYAGGADARKNLNRLINAYASLPSSLRDRYQLVLAGYFSTEEQLSIHAVRRRAGLTEGELCLTGYVTDDQLLNLYRACHAFVLPSWHEGFGLPALEAMACGAAVIAANASSLPEVMGLPDALFDPLSVPSMTAKIRQVLEDDAFAKRLREHGLVQCQTFSWAQTAQRVLRCFEDATAHVVTPDRSWQSMQRSWSQGYAALLEALTPEIVSETPDALKLLSVCIHANERQAKALARAVAMPDALCWRLEGPFDSSYSLALVNREVAKALASRGHQVALHSTEGPGDFLPDPTFLSGHPDLALMHSFASDLSEQQADVVSRNLFPPRVLDMSGCWNLLHAYAWEESGFPRAWVQAFNQALQGIAVTSAHVRKVLIDNGVSIPIAVTGNGVDHWERIEASSDFHVQARQFRFLHVSSGMPRKGVDVLLQAFGLAFNQTHDVTLIIKTFANPHQQVHEMLAKLRQDNPDYPDVQVLEEDLSDAELKALYEQCHVLVSPSRAEGFSLTVAEAMLSGLAVVTTSWSGQLDFCDDQTAWLVDYEFDFAKTHFDLYHSVWANPKLDDLVRQLKDVYQASAHEREHRARVGRQRLLEHFKWSDVSRRLETFVRTLPGRDVSVRPRIGWVTTWQARCGIASYSQHLLENFPTDVAILASRSVDGSPNDGAHVFRVWDQTESDTLQTLADTVDQLKLDTLVIQFNYGFFGFDNFKAFLERQLDNGVRVFCMLHATIDPTHAPHKKLAQLVGVFGRCERLLVHSLQDLNRLKCLGLAQNLMLFPHGIKDWTGASRSDRTAFVPGAVTLGTYGFFLPHKGLLELIEAVALLRQEGLPVALVMVNAQFPAAVSAELIARARRLIDKLGLGKVVRMHNEFMADEDSIALLRRADLVVYPYGQTPESASGAVRYGLSIGKPVAVTPSAIFDDVRQAVLTLPGVTVPDLVLGLRQLILDIQSGNINKRYDENVAKRWRTEHDYRRLGPRLYDMIVGVITNHHS